MNFKNLPADWPNIPLTDPQHIADVLDLFVSLRDRMTGSLLILICDAQRRPMQPLVINEIDADAAGADLLPLARLAKQVVDLHPDATVLCAIARRGRTQVTRTDRRWAQTLERAFADRLELIGVHLITLDGTVAITTKVNEAA